MRLFLLSPAMNRVLTLLRLALLAAFAYVLLTGRWPSLPRRARPAPIAALLALALLPAPVRAEQETPTPEILEELKTRLTRPAPCEPTCVTTPSLVLRLDASRLALSVEVHAVADGTWPLPGPVASWTPAEVRVDGTPAVAVARLANGFLHLRLPRGVHRVEAEVADRPTGVGRRPRPGPVGLRKAASRSAPAAWRPDAKRRAERRRAGGPKARRRNGASAGSNPTGPGRPRLSLERLSPIDFADECI